MQWKSPANVHWGVYITVLLFLGGTVLLVGPHSRWAALLVVVPAVVAEYVADRWWLGRQRRATREQSRDD